MMPSFVISTHSSSQSGGISPGHTSPKALPGATDLSVGDNYFINSRNERLCGHWVSFAEK
jgi:hypothetical protein